MSSGGPNAPSVDHLADPVFAVDPTGVLRYANDSAADTLGWDATELLDTDMLDLVHPDDVSLAKAALQTVVEKAFGELLTLRVRTGRGTWRYLEFRGTYRSPGIDDPFAGLIMIVGSRRHGTSPTRLRSGRHRGAACGDGEHARHGRPRRRTWVGAFGERGGHASARSRPGAGARTIDHRLPPPRRPRHRARRSTTTRAAGIAHPRCTSARRRAATR